MINHPNIPGLDVAAPWPYQTVPEMKDGTGPWRLLMSAGGGVTIWPSRKAIPFTLGMREFHRGSKKDVERFLGTFCRMGYEKFAEGDDEWDAYQHTGGQVWIFNWRSWNECQLAIASQVAEALFDKNADRYNEAWSIGKAFGDQIDAAENAHYASTNKEDDTA